jgi:pyrimidine operon attenuation protein/uracil phosphoribosyltransferase
MKKIMDESDIRRALVRIVHEILERNKGIRNIALIGIKRRGDFIARRIAEKIKVSEGYEVPLGALDITLYRDDLQLVSEAPIIEATDINFDVNKKTIILVDDVLYTGRTIRAAIDEILDFGRPRCIQLAVLVDRGCRELPIQADYVGKKVPAARNEIVDVLIKELDGEDCVLLHHERERKSETKTPKSTRSRIKLQHVPKQKVRQLTIDNPEKNES